MNVLQPNKKAAIITLLTNGISQREIERKVRVDRKTIRKYARMVGSNKPIGEGNSKSPEVAIDSGEGVDQNPPPRPPVQEASVSASESSEDEYPMSAHARSACDPHRLWIEEQVRLGRNAVSIYQDLVERFAFEHKYNSVKRFCRGLRRMSAATKKDGKINRFRQERRGRKEGAPRVICPIR